MKTEAFLLGFYLLSHSLSSRVIKYSVSTAIMLQAFARRYSGRVTNYSLLKGMPETSLLVVTYWIVDWVGHGSKCFFYDGLVGWVSQLVGWAWSKKVDPWTTLRGS